MAALAGTAVLGTGVAEAAAVLIAVRAPRLRSVGWAVALGLVLAGAIGNLCDRLMRTPGIGRGAVVDFIDLQHFADFNVADSCLTCEVVLTLLLSVCGTSWANTSSVSAAPSQPVSSIESTKDGAD